MSTEIMPVNEAQVNAWIALANEKNKIVATLTTKELEAQKILNDVKASGDYKAIDTALASYRKTHTDTVDKRKEFTSVIDKGIIQPLMAFEKRIDPKVNELYIELNNKSLSIRKEEADKSALVNAKNAEIGAFKAHFVGEFIRIEAEYKNKIRNDFQAYYQTCLNAGSKNGYEKTKEFLKEYQPPNPSKFNAKYLSKDEMTALFADIEKPVLNKVYDDLMVEMDDLFANFDSDLKNKEAAIKHHKQQAALKQLEEDKKAKEEAAISTLIASAETVQVEAPKIKKNLEIITVESEQWAKAVIAAFITNLPNLAKYIRVKSWSKLSIGQMAEYLSKFATDTGCAFPNLQLKEVEK